MKKISKFLSIILALTMVISMLPMSFATEGETEAADAGYKIVYDFVDTYTDAFYTERGSASTELNVRDILMNSYDYTYGFWALNGSATYVPAFNHYYNHAWATGVRVYLSASKPWFSMKIKVPVAGEYKLNLMHDKASSFESELDIYVLDGSTTEAAIAEKITSGTDKTGLVGTVDNTGENRDAVTAVSETAVTLDKKEYIVVFHAKSEDDYNDIRIKNLTLTSGDGSLLAPMYAELNGDKTLDAAINETVSFKALLSDGETWIEDNLSSYGITFESTNEAVAKVDEKGVVTAVSEGTATITAKNGDCVIGEEEVTVKKTPDAGVTVVYPMLEFVYTAAVQGTTPGNITYENVTSANRIEWDSYTTTVSGITAPGWGGSALNLYFMNDTEYAAYRINVPQSGKYNVSVMCGTVSDGSDGEMYLLPAGSTPEQIVSAFSTQEPVLIADFGAATASGGTNIGYTQFYADWKGNTPSTAIPVAAGEAVLDAGEYLVVWRGVGTKTSSSGTRYHLRPATMTLDGGPGLAIMDASIAEHDKTLSVDETTTVTATGTLSNTGRFNSEGGAAAFTYTSSNPDVATVDASTGVVTAISGGVAKITATCAGAIDGCNSVSTLIAVDEPSNKVSFGADASVDGIDITTSIDGYTRGEVGSVDISTKVEVSAPAAVGDYVFRGWVRGKAKGGRVISLDTTYSFSAMTNTYLTAIYTEAANEEYYAWNGEFLGTTKPESGSEPDVLGYSFKEWAESVASEKLTRFVAQYEQLTETYSVTYNGTAALYKYDDEVTLNSNSEVYWYRDGKLVDYGKEYKFNVWDKTVVTTSSEGHALPKLILDAKVKDGNYMVEYDANGKTIIEVGILFNGEDDKAPTVGSCEEKMNSQRDLSETEHGQFAAKAGTYTQARGYLIYQDGDAYKVIYSE